MIRRLLTTTALATVLTTGAMAQTTEPPMMAPLGEAVEQEMTIRAEGFLASNIIGETVYNGTGDGAENIGKVNDLVIGPDGQVHAVVIGVGGFLGIGRKDVAIEYDLVEWAERDGDRWMVVATTAEALKAQQEFDHTAYRPMPVDADVAETKPATADDLAAAQQEPTDDTALAPADEGPVSEDIAAAPADEEQAQETETVVIEPTDDQAAEQDTAAVPADEQQAEETETVVIEPTDEEAVEQDTAAAPADEQQALTDETRTGAIDRSGMAPRETADIRAEELIGTRVYGANDEHVGEIGDLVLTQDGQIDAVIIDVGGFLGIGEKQVAVGLDDLQFMTDADGGYHLYTNMTQEQLEAQPEYDEATYAERRDDMRMTITE